MPVSHFERLAEKSMAKIVQALLSVPTTDPAVARLQAGHAAFAEAIKIAKQAAMADEDGDVA
jgi:hypothetical protein